MTNSKYKKKLIALAGTVLAAMAMWLLLPSRVNPEKLEILMDRGSYHTVRHVAAEALSREPGNNQYREYLALAELELGRPEEALHHTCLLMGAGWDTSALEDRLNMARPQIYNDLAGNIRVLDVAQDNLHKYPHWQWLKQFSLNMVFQGYALSAPDHAGHI